jgi:hypothetical protein
MTEIAELEQRTNALVARYDSRAKKDRERRERLSELLSKIEESLAGSQREMERLSAERARADEENRQLRAMLQALLVATEDTRAPGTTPAMRNLESRIERLVDVASSITPLLGDGGGTAVGPEPDGEWAISLPEGNSGEARGVEEGDGNDSSQVENGEDKEPLELTQMVAAEDPAADLSGERVSSAGEEAAREPQQESEPDNGPREDYTTVTRLIKRLGELKGAPGEEQERIDPPPEADAATEKVT